MVVENNAVDVDDVVDVAVDGGGVAVLVASVDEAIRFGVVDVVAVGMVVGDSTIDFAAVVDWVGACVVGDVVVVVVVGT